MNENKRPLLEEENEELVIVANNASDSDDDSNVEVEKDLINNNEEIDLPEVKSEEENIKEVETEVSKEHEDKEIVQEEKKEITEEVKSEEKVEEKKNDKDTKEKIKFNRADIGTIVISVLVLTLLMVTIRNFYYGFKYKDYVAPTETNTQTQVENQ